MEWKVCDASVHAHKYALCLFEHSAMAICHTHTHTRKPKQAKIKEKDAVARVVEVCRHHTDHNNSRAFV